MKFWITVSLAMLLFWLITDLNSPSGLQNLFAPLVLSVLVMSALVRILLRLGLGHSSTGGDVGSGSDGADSGCGGDGGAC